MEGAQQAGLSEHVSVPQGSNAGGCHLHNYSPSVVAAEPALIGEARRPAVQGPHVVDPERRHSLGQRAEVGVGQADRRGAVAALSVQ